MSDFTLPLILDLDVVSLAMSLVNIGSETGDEGDLADSVETALTPLPHLTVERVGNAVVARTRARPDSGERVLVAGHLDTVAGEPDTFAYVEMGKVFGTGACDAKGGLAVVLKAAQPAYERDVTFLFYAGGEGAGL
ncbi:M20/M25/M40 family metallo-hydrolase, partial [Nocardioides hankookensis]